MRLFLLALAFVAAAASVGAKEAAAPVDGLVGFIARTPQQVTKWEPDIATFEQLDAETTDPDDAVLFLGSSSIRLWETIEADMAPWPVVRRGYGGASLLDLLHYAPRLVASHDPRAVVVFVGNDIKGVATDRTPGEMLVLFEALVPILRQGDADRDVFYIAVTPTPTRFNVWPQLRTANDLIRTYCESQPHTHYIETRDIYLADDGTVREDLFRDDRLHQNTDGYQRWSDRIKSRLLSVLGTVK